MGTKEKTPAVSEETTRREVFLQAEGKKGIELRQIPSGATAENMLDPGLADQLVFLEGQDESLAKGTVLDELGAEWPVRLHVHRCRSIAVSINYGSGTESHDFAPGRTLASVRKWVIGEDGFDITAADAADLVLQVCDSQERPDDDAHVGTLTSAPACSVCFDLVPRHWVEGKP